MMQEIIEKLSWHTGKIGKWEVYELIYNPNDLLCFQANYENIIGISETKFLSVPPNGEKVHVTSNLTGDYFQDDDKYMLPGHFVYELNLEGLKELKEALGLNDETMEKISEYNKRDEKR